MQNGPFVLAHPLLGEIADYLRHHVLLFMRKKLVSHRATDVVARLKFHVAQSFYCSRLCPFGGVFRKTTCYTSQHITREQLGTVLLAPEWYRRDATAPDGTPDGCFCVGSGRCIVVRYYHAPVQILFLQIRFSRLPGETPQ